MEWFMSTNRSYKHRQEKEFRVTCKMMCLRFYMYRRTYSRLDILSFIKLNSISGSTVSPRFCRGFPLRFPEDYPILCYPIRTSHEHTESVIVSDSAAVYYVISDSNILAESLRDKIPKIFNSFLQRYFNLVESSVYIVSIALQILERKRKL